ncbi:MAG: dihydroorotase [Clostridiales bacterium]|nr:dihydroorotase [Clostridiales bacterium]
MDKILIKNGRVIDPLNGIDGKRDVLISHGVIESVSEELECDEATVIDAEGLTVTPGLIDLHVHFREPGFEYKETIKTGAKAAVAGGFTSVVCMPNTRPAIDSPETLDKVHKLAEDADCRVYALASATMAMEGKELTDFATLHKKGALGFTDDGGTVQNGRLVYEGLLAAKQLGVPVVEHCEDMNFMNDRSINQGEVSAQLGCTGVPGIAEDLIVLRDLYLAERTGGHIHIQHLSTKESVRLIREAKKRGVNVTCEVTPHHFSLTESAVLKEGSNAKMSPPLRTQEDLDEIIIGIKDGTIDAIATDHAPHTEEEKAKGIVEGPNGIIGLETALGLALTELHEKHGIGLKRIFEMLCVNPAAIMNLKGGSLTPGQPADVTITDINREWVVQKDKFFSKARNMPYEGMQLKGKTVTTIVGGRIVYKET